VALKWYVVHTYSGYENKVKTALEERIGSSEVPKVEECASDATCFKTDHAEGVHINFSSL